MNQSCEFCGKVVKKLKFHPKVPMCGKDVDNSKPLQCPKCDRKVIDKSKLFKHIQYINDRVKTSNVQIVPTKPTLGSI